MRDVVCVVTAEKQWPEMEGYDANSDYERPSRVSFFTVHQLETEFVVTCCIFEIVNRGDSVC